MNPIQKALAAILPHPGYTVSHRGMIHNRFTSLDDAMSYANDMAKSTMTCETIVITGAFTKYYVNGKVKP